jgi:hypothetical protein
MAYGGDSLMKHKQNMTFAEMERKIIRKQPLSKAGEKPFQ